MIIWKKQKSRLSAFITPAVPKSPKRFAAILLVICSIVIRLGQSLRRGLKWVAPLEYGGTTDSTLFEFWFENCLLQEAEPGSIIILDNATFHKKSVLPALVQKFDCEIWFLHPYSPDLNPIEKKWAWLKRKLRELLPFHFSFDNAIHHPQRHKKRSALNSISNAVRTLRLGRIVIRGIEQIP